MKILIVEDDEKLAQTLRTMLEEEGCTIDAIADGTRGENRILTCRNDYDVVILDLNLPGKNGLLICKHVREMGVSVPILILTARADIVDKVLALNSGADDYLVKPFSFSELYARLLALTRRPQETLPLVLTVQDLILNPVTRGVTRNGRSIELTHKEFEFLAYLMKHVNQVKRREDIFAHLWDFADSSLSNVIDAHMKNLRKKIDDGHAIKLLETIRGVGYVIKA